MKFKDGAPKKLYAIVWQDSGETETYTNKSVRDMNWYYKEDSEGNQGVRATYTLVEDSVTSKKGVGAVS
jgi:hypothetical protein